MSAIFAGLTMIVILFGCGFSIAGGLAVFPLLRAAFGDISAWWIIPSILTIGYSFFSLLNQLTGGQLGRLWFGYDEKN